MFSKVGRVQMASQDVAGARQSYDNSLAVYAAIARSDPQNPQYQRDLSLSYGKTGDMRAAQGDRVGALESYRNFLATADLVAKSHPDKGDWQRDVIVACIKIADLDPAQAQAMLMRASEVANSVQARRQLAPADSWMPADIAARLAVLGRTESGAGKSDSAGGSTAPSAPPTGPDDAQRACAFSYGNWGDRQAAQGDLTGALNSYRAANAIFRDLQQNSADDPHCQHDLSISSWKIGDVYMAQGDFERAQAAYRAGLDLAEQVARSDSNNAEWQRSLSVSLNKVGDAQRAQGNLANAFKYYHEGLSVVARLAQSKPTDLQLQYDLGISNERIGNVLLERGDLAGALQWYMVRQNIISRLAQSDPNNAAWQRDVVVSYVKCAWADPSQARTWLTRAAELASSMQARGMLTPGDRGIPGDIARQIAELP
jgi:tetratricopeptide (TPR) repeat protein